MVHYPNITRNWNLIATRPVKCNDESAQPSSLNGRKICLVHTLATPLKAFAALGKLILSTVDIATRVFGVITLNEHPKSLRQAGASVIDVIGGSLLLPVAIVANLVRGVVGTIFYPGALIAQADKTDSQWSVRHNCLAGTVVNYPWLHFEEI